MELSGAVEPEASCSWALVAQDELSRPAEKMYEKSDEDDVDTRNSCSVELPAFEQKQLHDLPHDLLVRVVTILPLRERFVYSLSSRFAWNVLHEPVLWREIDLTQCSAQINDAAGAMSNAHLHTHMYIHTHMIT